MRIQSNALNHRAYQPKRAIIIYEPSHGQSYQTPAEETASSFATIHDITNDNNPQLQPGELLTSTGLTDALHKLNQAALSFLTPNVLASSNSDLIWYSHAQHRRLFFQTTDEYLNTTVNGLNIPMPAMLWHAKPRNLSVYALDTNERPTLDTPLHHTPLFNTYETGLVCLGNTVLPGTLNPDDTLEYERGFFASAFTHANQMRLYQNYSGTIGQLLKSLEDQDEYPTKHLVPMNKTVRSLFE